MQQIIAALFVQADGCYFGADAVDAWDEMRDARRYKGPHPVVAHPPPANDGAGTPRVRLASPINTGLAKMKDAFPPRLSLSAIMVELSNTLKIVWRMITSVWPVRRQQEAGSKPITTAAGPVALNKVITAISRAKGHGFTRFPTFCRRLFGDDPNSDCRLTRSSDTVTKKQGVLA